MGVSWLKQCAKGWSFIPLPQNPYYTVVDFKLLWQQAVLYIFFIINYLHFVLQAKFGMPKVWQDGSTMNAMREASSRFSMFINKLISSPLEWQNSLRVLYFGKVDHECNPGGIVKILYAHKWIHIFSFLGILKCNFRGWWRKKAAPRWSGTSKKGIHDWLWI